MYLLLTGKKRDICSRKASHFKSKKRGQMNCGCSQYNNLECPEKKRKHPCSERRTQWVGQGQWRQLIRETLRQLQRKKMSCKNHKNQKDSIFTSTSVMERPLCGIGRNLIMIQTMIQRHFADKSHGGSRMNSGEMYRNIFLLIYWKIKLISSCSMTSDPKHSSDTKETYQSSCHGRRRATKGTFWCHYMSCELTAERHTKQCKHIHTLSQCHYIKFIMLHNYIHTFSHINMQMLPKDTRHIGCHRGQKTDKQTDQNGLKLFVGLYIWACHVCGYSLAVHQTAASYICNKNRKRCFPLRTSYPAIYQIKSIPTDSPTLMTLVQSSFTFTFIFNEIIALKK